MDRGKQIDLIRKRNTQLNEQLDKVKFELEYDRMLNREGYKYAKDLISELEDIKKRWIEALEDLKNKQDEYQMLVDDIKRLRDRMSNGVGGVNGVRKVPWYRRWFGRVK